MSADLSFIINSKVEILWNEEYYKSNIQNVDSNSISISIPTKEGQYIPLRKSDKVEVLYYLENDIYKFNTVVLDRKIDTIPIIMLAHPEKVIKVQRRKFVRVPVICDMECFIMQNNKKQSSLKAVLVDLSGGGMRIKVSDKLKLGDKITAYIPIEDEQVQIKGEVVRVDKDDISKLNICGINFVEIDERIREKIIKFIFHIMRKQMKKGTIR